MSGVDEAWRLFDEAFAISSQNENEEKPVDFSKRIMEIGYGDCNAVLEMFMIHEKARKLFNEKSAGSFAVAVNQVIGLAVLAGQTTRDEALVAYGITKK